MSSEFLYSITPVDKHDNGNKYLMDGDLGLKVYIDKTPPVINIKSDTIDESYSKSDLINIIKV